MNWLWQNPPPAAQWVGIFVTCVGTLLSLGAVWFARSARTAARAAKHAAERSAAVYELQALQDDLADLLGLCSSADLSLVRQRVARLAPRIRLAAAPLVGERADLVIEAAKALAESDAQFANMRTAESTKRNQVAAAVVVAAEAVSVAQLELRTARRND